MLNVYKVEIELDREPKEALHHTIMMDYDLRTLFFGYFYLTRLNDFFKGDTDTNHFYYMVLGKCISSNEEHKIRLNVLVSPSIFFCVLFLPGLATLLFIKGIADIGILMISMLFPLILLYSRSVAKDQGVAVANKFAGLLGGKAKVVN